MIGRGAFGVVYRAWDTTLNRAVAFKRPRAGALEAPEAVERFLREARSAAGLRHPHIVPVFDSGQVDGEPYLVSALVEGRNLADGARRPPPRVPQGRRMGRRRWPRHWNTPTVRRDPPRRQAFERPDRSRAARST